MSRNLGSPMITAITSNGPIGLLALVDITLKTGSAHVWSGVGTLSWNGNTYLGVGSLGEIGDVKEGIEVRAEGTTIALSGIDPNLLTDCLSDIQIGAPATIWFGVFQNGAIVGTPYPLFSGTVDKPSTPIGTDSLTIALALESKMTDHARATMRRYTSSDQRYYYSDDIGLHWVETLADIALRWGG
ncbi:MAG TPA: hypothetical protein VKB47_18010 [Terracidiphilus sp.]|nr:hypothetical protein [Terracidiphilus sp.]